MSALDNLYSPHTEEALIGSCLLAPDMFAECRPMIRTGDFHDHRLRWVWESLCRLTDAGTTPDYITVCKDLGDHRQLAEVGGEGYITKLLGEPANAMNAPDYARIVAHDGTRRRLVETAEDIAKRAFDKDRDVTETLHFAEVAFASVDHGHSIRADFSKRFNLCNASDAMKPLPPITWRVEKLIRDASINLLVGDPGSKKTWAMLDLAVCVALGKSWLGLQTEQSPVLIVDEESGHRRMAERLGLTLRGHLANEDTPVWYISLSQVDIRNNNDTAALSDLIEVTQAKLIIIDSLVDVMPGADENAVGDTQPVFLKLRALAEKTSAAIIVIHHNNKLGGYRGSTAIKGAVDLMLTVKSEASKELIEFGFEKARDIQPFSLAAEARFGDGQFYLVETDHPDIRQESAKTERIENAMIQALEDARPDKLSSNKLCDAAGGNKENARMTLEKMVKDGRIIRTPGERKGTFAHSLP